jgi:hypothetical protein
MKNSEKGSPGEVVLGDLNLEQHAKAALLTANILAAGKPINAADLLRAVIILSRNGTTYSDAFSFLASLLPLENLPTKPRIKGVSRVRLVEGLAKSYSIAETYFSTGTNIWGRDIVAIALLADYDPSLSELANEAETTVDALQDEWFNFVTSNDRTHRSPEDWRNWWKSAGVPLPEERLTISGSTYLFLWNPEKFDQATIEKTAKNIETSGPSIMNWGTGARRQLSSGERVFLLRQGVEPRGLVGSGRIEGEVKNIPHWDEEKRKQGKMSWIVPVRWDRLSTSPLIKREELIRETGEEKVWNAQAGGVKLTTELAAILEQLWEQAVGGTTAFKALRFARTLSDLDHRNDWIGIRSDVEALSTLIAVNQVEPPLSIAIFGDWGSGKTFLMRKIQERTQILEQVGKAQEKNEADDQERPRYCSSILQIEFNAWHYTESNLWASLVNHIFEKLYWKLTPEDKGKQHADKVEAFFQQLETARAAREAAETKIQLVSAEVELARDAVNKASDDMQKTGRRFSSAQGRSVWKYLEKMLKKRGSEEEALKDALQYFGFKDSLNSAQTIYDTVQRFRSVSGRAREVFGSLLATRGGVLGAFILTVVVIFATFIAIKYKVSILSVGTIFAGTLAWFAERAGRARKWLDKIQTFDEWFSALKNSEESRIATELAKVQAEFEQRKEALAEARRQYTEAQMREARAKEDLKNLTARDQMRRFVDERVTTQTYARHLGLISMIRRDFEDLSDFMYRDRQPGEARLVKRVSTAVREAIPTVERIILYIDDLDRCQPERVVEVLEAIHLLLAFRLFIVVVAVDPRWVLESLRHRYPHLAENHHLHMPESSSAYQQSNDVLAKKMATAHDYLEKIFNIPFWVRPMGPDACETLVAGYLGFSEVESEAPEEKTQKEAERFHDIFQERPAQHSSIPDQPLLKIGEDITSQKKPKKAQSQKGKPTTKLSAETFDRQIKERITAERKIEHVEINSKEQKSIRNLAPHLGNSPRRIKRYANTYRLMKSGLTIQEARQFSDSNGSDDYRLLLVFLAIITGAPSLAPQVFSKAFALRAEFDIDALIKQSGLLDPSADPFETKNAKGALELLRGIPITRDKIETWIPRVMRYAFRLTPVNVTAI